MATERNPRNTAASRSSASPVTPPPRPRSSVRKAAGNNSDKSNARQTEANSELEESQDENEIIVGALLALGQMDSEAALAYETAAELISDAAVRSSLEGFADDHRRHVEELGRVIEGLGGQAALAAPPPDASVFSLLVSAAAPMGDRAILLSLMGSEQFTTATYSTALELISEEGALSLLQRNLGDEQRHLSWLERATAREVDGEEG